MPLSADYRPIKPDQPSVFDSPMTAAIKTAMRWMGLNTPEDQILALMAPMETTGPVGGLVGAIQKRMQRIPNPIKAFHGSPHDFDAFSMEKIGTGEGAQAYGHGLYFAEKPQTAAYYKDALSKQQADPRDAVNSLVYNWWSVPGGPSRPMTPQEAASLMGDFETLRPLMGDPEIAANVAQYVNGHSELGGSIDSSALKALKTLDRRLPKPPPGKMYEVNIHATPDQLLDWDKPLSQQSETVRQALERLPRAGREAIEASHAPSYLTGRSPQPWTGNTAYRALEDAVYPAANEAGQRTAPYMLREAGIPGIQYLDGGSRGAGEGTRNYVIWDDALIEVLRKFGVAVPVIEALRREAQANNGRLDRQKVEQVMQ